MELLAAILGCIGIIFVTMLLLVIWLLTSRVIYVVICAVLAVWLWKYLKEKNKL